MENSNDNFYSVEAITLFAEKPPLLIRWSCFLICIFIIILTISGSLINVPYIYKVQVHKIENNYFLFRNEKEIVNNKLFKIVTLDGEELEVKNISCIYVNSIAYIRFALNKKQKILIEDHGVYNIVVCISLIDCYLYYIFHGV